MNITDKTAVEDCDHLKSDSGFDYRPAVAIPVGPFRNIVLCKNCWNTIRAMAYAEILTESARQVT